MERTGARPSELQANLNRIRGERDTVARDLRDLGKAFAAISNPSASIIAEYLAESMALRVSRAPGITVELPQFTFSDDRLAELRAQDPAVAIAVDMPDVLTPAVLEMMYPKLARHWTLQAGSDMNQRRHAGYFTYRNVAESPHLRTNINDIENRKRQTGEELLHPFEYFMTGYALEDQTGTLPDRKTVSRIADPRVPGGVLDAYFVAYGGPSVVQNWNPEVRHIFLGARFKGVT